MTDYEKFSAALNERVKKKIKRNIIKKMIMIELEKYIPFFCLLIGTICLQAGWGHFKLVSLFWIFTAAAFAVTTWYVVDDFRYVFGKDGDE